MGMLFFSFLKKGIPPQEPKGVEVLGNLAPKKARETGGGNVKHHHEG
jgi:hypothetical protein